MVSFLRFGYLRECLSRVRLALPECPVIVADNSDKRPPALDGVELILLPFDSGLTVCRNAIVKAAKTPYILMFCDDFDASTASYREGLTKAVGLLETHPEIDLVGGRVNSNPYEADLVHDREANVIREIRVVPSGAPYQRCDLVVNHFVARTATLLEVPWDEAIVPIGGEHGDWFLDMKAANKTTVWLPGLNVNTLSLGQGPDMQDPRYNEFRRRCFSMGHAKMLKKRGIKDWVGA